MRNSFLKMDKFYIKRSSVMTSGSTTYLNYNLYIMFYLFLIIYLASERLNYC